MKLSEQLRIDHESGDFGKALEGYSDRAKNLEAVAYDGWLKEATNWGAPISAAVEYADKRMSEI